MKNPRPIPAEAVVVRGCFSREGWQRKSFCGVCAQKIAADSLTADGICSFEIGA